VRPKRDLLTHWRGCRYQADVRLLAQRGKSLFEHKVGAAKQQAKEEEGKAELKIRLQTMEKDLSAQRKRNTELLSQVHMLDDGKMLAEKASREAVSRARELEERLQLLSTLHKCDLGKLGFDERARTEDDVDRLFAADMSATTTAAHVSRPPSGAASRAVEKSRLLSRPSSGKPGSLLPSRPSSAATSASASALVRPASAAASAAPLGRPPSAGCASRAPDRHRASPLSGDAAASRGPSLRQRPASASRVATSSALMCRDAVAVPHGKVLPSGSGSGSRAWDRCCRAAASRRQG